MANPSAAGNAAASLTRILDENLLCSGLSTLGLFGSVFRAAFGSQMDFAFFRFITDMNRKLTLLLKTMSALSDRVIKVLQDKADLKTELAKTKAELAAALANDAADAERIAAAEADAEAAQTAAEAAVAKAAELQALADADAEEDAIITAALDKDDEGIDDEVQTPA